MDEEKKETKSSNNLIVAIIATLLIAGGAGFFAGMKYQQSKMPSFMKDMPADFQDRMANRGERPDGSQGLRPVSGEIISKDEGSITVKLQDDSSKIILLTDTSSINKTEEGTSDDLTEGAQITVFGQENSDGSITAQNILLFALL